MNRQPRNDQRSAQAGGITILVSLMLLVLLTIAAVGMSRNSFREVVTSGFTRQGAMARSVADSGIEWSLYWVEIKNAPMSTGTALNMINLKSTLLMNDTLAGVAKDINYPDGSQNYQPGRSLQADLKLPGTATLTQGFTIGLTRMGKLPITDMGQGVGTGAFTPATGGPLLLAPDLWAVRADAQVQQGGVTGPTFIHAKEAWISTPVQ